MKALLRRENLLMTRHFSLYCAPVAYYLIVLTLFPLILNIPNSQIQSMIAPLIWFAISLSFMTVMPHLYASDFQSGLLDQIKLTQQDLKQYLFTKLVSTWLAVFLPMLVVLPLIALIYNLSFNHFLTLAATIASGGIMLTSVGMLLMIVAIGLETQQAILAVMYLPLLMPLIMLGASVLDPLVGKMSVQLLIGFSLLDLIIICPVCNYLLQVMLYE